MSETKSRFHLSEVVSSSSCHHVSVIRWAGKLLENSSHEKPVDIVESISSELLSRSNSKKEERIQKYRCSFCNKYFKWYSHWKSHERTHTGERPFQCEICGKAFTRSDGLQCHKITHMTKNGVWFSQEETPHELIVLNAVKQLQIESSNPSRRTQITLRHEVSKLFRCQICNRAFLSSVGLSKHLQVHKGRREHKCEICNMVFLKRSAFEIHSRVHTGEKPYRCHICAKSFSIHGNLKRHLYVHTEEKPYKCPERKSHLEEHIRNLHQSINICSIKF